MTTTNSTQQKPWFANAIELFNQLQNSSIEQEEFMKKVTNLSSQILSLTPKKFDLEEGTITRLASVAFKDVSKASEGRNKALVGTDLFKLIISMKEPSKDALDHEYYKNEIVIKQLRGFGQMNKLDLSKIAEDQDTLNWLCEANETLQTADERYNMRVSMSKIPTDYYNQTLLARMEIGKLITSKELCLQVISLLRGEGEEKGIASIDSKAKGIVEAYRKLIIIPASNK